MIRGIVHPVFDSKSDFETYFTNKDGLVPNLVENWRLAEEGDWVVADDEGIVQILKRGTARHHSNKKDTIYFRTIVGSFTNDKASYMDTDFLNHTDRYTFSRKSDRVKAYTNRKTNKQLKVLFSIALCTKIYIDGVITPEFVVNVYRKVFNYYEKDVASKAMNLLKSRGMRTMMAENIKDIAEAHGITATWFVENIKDLADHSKNDNVRLSATIESGKIIGVVGVPQLDKRLRFIEGDIEDAEIEELERPKELKDGK